MFFTPLHSYFLRVTRVQPHHMDHCLSDASSFSKFRYQLTQNGFVFTKIASKLTAILVIPDEEFIHKYHSLTTSGECGKQYGNMWKTERRNLRTLEFVNCRARADNCKGNSAYRLKDFCIERHRRSHWERSIATGTSLYKYAYEVPYRF